MTIQNLTMTAQQFLAPARIYYANDNCLISAGNHWGLIDLKTGLALGFPGKKIPYHPVGNYAAVNSVSKSGFVPGCQMLGFKVELIGKNIYKLI